MPLMFASTLPLEESFGIGKEGAADKRQSDVVSENGNLTDGALDRASHFWIEVGKAFPQDSLSDVGSHRSNQVPEFEDEVPELSGAAIESPLQQGSGQECGGRHVVVGGAPS